MNVPKICTDWADAAPATVLAMRKAELAAILAVMLPRCSFGARCRPQLGSPHVCSLWTGFVDGVHRRRHAAQGVGVGGLGALERGAMHHELRPLLERGHEHRFVVHAG